MRKKISNKTSVQGKLQRQPDSNFVGVWLDNKRAEIFVFHGDEKDPETTTIEAPEPVSTASLDKLKHYFHQVIDATRDAEEITVAGPATFKELLRKEFFRTIPLSSKLAIMNLEEEMSQKQLKVHVKKACLEHEFLRRQKQMFAAAR